ncbi:hypothetical protein PGTUg99_002894 [Puccinia graminis f. sp. tritici]|uniref:Uncharacterized protein n=1 Tax=Puccinia graminis f. sp. tritici TaxID=56615 RepID=A0A5B0NQC3_PUCGR|nr:hypothetical protein PGTUg99_002894 [Puccinia graminis f. sp. tritici]
MPQPSTQSQKGRLAFEDCLSICAIRKFTLKVRLGLLSVSFTLLATNIFRVMTNSSSWACLIDFISDFAIGAGPIAGAFFTAQERAVSCSQSNRLIYHFRDQTQRLLKAIRNKLSVKAARPKIQVEIKSKREVFCQSKVTAIDAEPLTEGQATTVTYRSSNT